MTRFGYTMMTEQSRPDALIGDLVAAEQAGFDFSVCSDHYQPWLAAQGHAGYAWSILGAAAQATDQIDLMTYVTCPTMRYHPAVVAQKAATMAILSDNRFRLGLGTGENLNEHVVGKDWPAVGKRLAMLSEAVQIIRALLDGAESYNFRGRYFDVEQARLWDLPSADLPIGIAVSGPQSCALAGKYADAMIAVEPKRELGEMFDGAGGTGKPRIGQVPVCFDLDRDRAISRAHAQFRWFSFGWKVNADLPGPDGFAAASSTVTEADVAAGIPCGPDLDTHLDAIRPFLDAGYDEIALIQIGGEDQRAFIDWAHAELLPALRDL